MPRWRTRDGAPHDAPWHPIRLVRYDLDTRRADDLPKGVSGDRVWFEATRSGDVVGLYEARLDDGQVTKGLADELTSAFKDDGDRASPVPDAQLGFASVVVPTLWRRPEQLAGTIASLDSVDYPNFEIVVVDNRRGSANDALTFPDHPRVRVVREPHPGVSAARNRGFAATTGEFVAFTDDDAVVDAGWLRGFGSRFASEPEVDALGGLVLPSELDTQAQLWFEEYYGGFTQSFQRSTVSLARTHGNPLFPYAPGRYGAGCNMAFRRATLEELGGFDTMLGTGTPARGGEDLSIFIQLVIHGGTVGFEPSALVRHSHRRSETEFLAQVRDYGTGLTAMYTSLVVRDPSTILQLLRRVPAGIRLLLRPGDGRSPSAAATSYPRRALAWQLLGMAIGPVAFSRSWARTRSAVRTSG
jgi:GT2 family glycosyltransferase